MAARTDKLKTYREKRDFRKTAEPRGGARPAQETVFVIQKHDASRLHYDLRLEIDGVLASWAVPKGPSIDPGEKRLAVRTEDHPLEYADFEGVIPEGEYGGGTVLIWDRGLYRNLRAEKPKDPRTMAQSLEEGKIEVRLEGRKLKGTFALVRTGFGKPTDENWLLIKMKDKAAPTGPEPVEAKPRSVKTGRSLEQIAKEEKPTSFRVASPRSRARPS